jgi:hypothetical protein
LELRQPDRLLDLLTAFVSVQRRRPYSNADLAEDTEYGVEETKNASKRILKEGGLSPKAAGLAKS